MMKTLRLSLLGSPHLVMGTQPLNGFATNKAQALLYYLAVTGQPHSRDRIATLLWDEMTDTQAKKNLRTVLPDLRRLLNDHLLLDRQRIAFQRNSPYWLDVEVFRRDLAPGQTGIDLTARQAVVDLYQGEFLSGFFVHNAPAFDEWVVGQREELHTLLVMALGALVNDYAQGLNWAAAIAVNRRLLGLEPWSEPAHRQQMLLLAQMGERSAALAQYETCQRILAAEFGVAPLPETTGLYEQIRTGEIGQSATTRQPYNVNAAESTMPRTPEQLPPLAEQPVAEVQVRPQPLTQVDGYNLPQATKLYGRQSEMVALQKWIVDDGCRLVGIFGIGGQGKSTLAATLVHRLAELKTSPQAVGYDPGVIQEGVFARIIWESLLNAPPLSEVIQKWLYLLSDQSMTTPSSSLDEQFTQLLTQLRDQRCLLILDNLESILQSDEPCGDDRSGYYRPGYEAYGQLIRHLALGEHRSCLFITSRERPQSFAHLEEDSPAVRFWNLAGLRDDAGRQMMAARGVVGSLVDLATLSQHYSGNPLALKLAADTIDTLFDGNIAGFLQADAFIFDDIRDVLDQQFARLAPLEREIMTWLAIVREPIAYTTLRGLLAQPPAPRLALEAIRSLQRRSLLEKHEDGFTLQNVVLEYTTELLVDGICAELMPADQDVTNPNALPFLNRYALMLAQAKEYVRASQTRLLLQPVCDRLLTQLGIRGSAQQLQTWLAHLRDRQPTPGYAAANLLHLLLQLGIDLRGYDFSQLYLRQLYLRGVTLPQVNFAKSEIVESVFTEPFGIVYTVVFSPDGQYLAAGTSEGAIYLWRTADQQLVQVIQAHSQSVYEVAFVYRETADGVRQLLLASASVDKSVALWSLVAGEPMRWYSQLTHEQQDTLLAIAFHPNSQRVMTASNEGEVLVWDVQSPTEACLVQHFANTPTRLRLVAFSRDGKTVVVGNRDGTVQWRELATGDLILSLTTPTGSIGSLALSHDGQFLVTGGKEGHICLWALPAGELLQVIETKARIVDALAFSTDDKMITSSHTDRAVRVWRMDDQHRLHLHHTLLGHRQIVWTVAFGLSQSTRFAGNDPERHPEARHLIASGSSDQTVRVWDAETGQALYTLRGQPRALAYFAISPLPKTPSTDPPGSAWLLVAVGYDRLVHLWQGRDNQVDNTYRSLRHARSSLYTVAISPDGCKIASAGGDESIDLWDVASGQLLKTFHGHTNSILMVAFHPHQEMLASAASDGTVRLWSLHKVEQAGVKSHPTLLPATSPVVYDIAFSPNGRVLACAGAELTLRFWDITESQPTELIAARKHVREASEQDILAVAFSPDGRKLACGGNNVLHLWDLCDNYFDDIDQNTGQDTGQDRDQVDSPLILRHHTTWIYSIAFSPDSTLLASCSADCTVCLWDAASGTLRHILTGHTEAIFKVAFNLDGATVLSCSFDGTIKFWDVQTGACVNTLAVDGPYAGMNIHEMTGITEAQKVALKALGAVKQS